MINDLSKLNDLLLKTFTHTYNLGKDKNYLDKNYNKSAKLLYEISNNIKNQFFEKSTELKVQIVDDAGKKSRGEWLYDACIIKEKEIIDETGDKKETKEKIPVKILLAIESEFDTSLKSFVDDFGKLICSNSNQILFIAGLNQKEEREKFIKRRVDMINKYLIEYLTNLILVFFPSPYKMEYEKSIWNEYSFTELCLWIRIYSINIETKKLELQNPLLEQKSFSGVLIGESPS